MSQPTKTQSRQDSHKIAKKLFEIERPYKDMVGVREDLKTKLREYGSQDYIFEGGVVKVGEPEVRTFKGQTFKLDPNKFAALSVEGRKALIDQGLVVIEDIYSRNAVAKVETTLL